MPPSPSSSDVEDDSRPLEDWQKPRPLSCKECRRAKLRCDRKIPCSSCVRRGCESICPDGVVTAAPTNANRGMLSDNRKQRDKHAAMQGRMIQLEAAIAAIQEAKRSASGSPPNGPVADETEDLARTFGTLDIGERPTFLGPNAISNYLAARASTSKQSERSVTFAQFIQLIPDVPLAAQLPNVVSQIAERLPTRDVCEFLLGMWLRGGALVGYDAAGEDLLMPVVEKLYATPPICDDLSLHTVAVLFLVFAHASLLSPDAEAGERQSRKYHGLACDLLMNIDSIIRRPTLEAVTAMFILSWYLQILDDPNTAGQAYMVHGLTARISHCMGLHRNDSPWNLDPKEHQRRRNIFWSCVAVDYYVAENLGRPPSYVPGQIDALLPDDPSPYILADGSHQESFTMWFLSFARECLLPLLSQAMGTHHVDRHVVQRLDALIRNHRVADVLRIREPIEIGIKGKSFDPGFDADADPAAAAAAMDMILTVLKQHTVYLLTQKMLMLLHRPFFVMAVREQEGVETPHSSSMFAAYEAAISVARCARSQYAVMPQARPIWFVWNAAFSACAILAAFIIHRRQGARVIAAIEEVDEVCVIFGLISERSKNIARLNAQLLRMRNAARAAIAVDRTQGGSVLERELDFMLGRGRVVGKPDSSPETTSSSASSIGVVTPSSDGSHSLPPVPSSVAQAKDAGYSSAADGETILTRPFQHRDRSEAAPPTGNETYFTRELAPVVVQAKPMVLPRLPSMVAPQERLQQQHQQSSHRQHYQPPTSVTPTPYVRHPQLQPHLQSLQPLPPLQHAHRQAQPQPQAQARHQHQPPADPPISQYPHTHSHVHPHVHHAHNTPAQRYQPHSHHPHQPLHHLSSQQQTHQPYIPQHQHQHHSHQPQDPQAFAYAGHALNSLWEDFMDGMEASPPSSGPPGGHGHIQFAGTTPGMGNVPPTVQTWSSHVAHFTQAVPGGPPSGGVPGHSVATWHS